MHRTETVTDQQENPWDRFILPLGRPLFLSVGLYCVPLPEPLGRPSDGLPEWYSRMMMMITAFGATNVPAATTKLILTIMEIKKRSKNNNNNQCIFHRFIKERHNVFISTQDSVESSCFLKRRIQSVIIYTIYTRTTTATLLLKKERTLSSESNFFVHHKLREGHKRQLHIYTHHIYYSIIGLY